MGAGCEGHRARGMGGVGFGSRYQGGESEDREGGLPAADTFILRRTPMAAPIIDAGSAHQTLTDTVRTPIIGDRQSEGPHHWCSICTPHPHPKPSHTHTHTHTPYPLIPHPRAPRLIQNLVYRSWEMRGCGVCLTVAVRNLLLQGLERLLDPTVPRSSSLNPNPEP